MVFTCPRCRYETAYKCNLKKHLSRKKQCKTSMDSPINENYDTRIKSLEDRIQYLEIKLNFSGNLVVNSDKMTNNLNPYTKENTDHITKEYVQKLVKRGVHGSITKLVSAIHFDDKHPDILKNKKHPEVSFFSVKNSRVFSVDPLEASRAGPP